MKQLKYILLVALAALGLTLQFSPAVAENWATIVTTDPYATLLSRLQGRDVDNARMFATDQTASSNAPANTIRFNWASKTFERCTGSGLTSCASVGTLGHAISGAAPWASVTGKPTTLSGYGITDASPLNTTLADNAGSTTLPTTASGTVVSKVQSLRDNVKQLLSYFSAGKANSAATADAAPWSGITSKPTTLSGYGITDASPLNTTLADNAGSTTLPTTASGTVVSKVQSLRDNVKQLLSYFTAGKANSAAAADTAAALSGTQTLACTGDVTCPATAYGAAGAKSLPTTLANSGVTAGAYGETGSSRTLAFGGTMVVPEITVDAKGRATTAREVTLTLPAAPTSVATATNLAGGAAGSLPYQSAAGVTGMLPAGTSGYFLRSQGAAAPQWRAPADAFADIKQAATTSASGVVELATDAETVTGTDTARATHSAGVKAAINAGLAGAALGVGQTWQQFTVSNDGAPTSRYSGTTYQNTTGKPIMVSVTREGGGSAIYLHVGATAGSYVMIAAANPESNVGITASAIVPPNHYYKVTGVLPSYWVELR